MKNAFAILIGLLIAAIPAIAGGLITQPTPVASTTIAGKVKCDGITTTCAGDGTITATAGGTAGMTTDALNATLPDARTNLGLGTTSDVQFGTLALGGALTLSTAASTTPSFLDTPGSRASWYGNNPGQRWQLAIGSAASPILTRGAAFSISEYFRVPLTECTAPYNIGCATGLLIDVTGDAATEMVTSGMVVHALGSSTAAGTDVQAINSIAEVSGSGTGTGMGAFINGRRNTNTGRSLGMEVSSSNATTTNCNLGYINVGDCDGIWLSSRGLAGGVRQLSSALHIGSADGVSIWREGLTFNPAGVLDTTFNDKSSSTTSIDITGTHTTAINTGAGAGDVTLAGGNTTVTGGTFKISSNITPILNATTAGQQAAFRFQDATTTKWTLGKQTDNAFFLYDAANALGAYGVSAAGDTTLGETGKTVTINGIDTTVGGNLTVAGSINGTTLAVGASETDINAAIAAAINAGKKGITLEHGTYSVAKTGADVYGQNYSLLISGASDFTFDCNGSTLLMSGLNLSEYAHVIDIINSNGVTLRNCIIDYAKLPFAQSVLSAKGATTADFQVDPDYPITWTTVQRIEYFVPSTVASVPAQPQPGIIIEHGGGNRSITALGGGLYQVDFSADGAGLAAMVVGRSYLLTTQVFGANGVNEINNTNLTFDNVRCYASAGQCIAGWGGTNLTALNGTGPRLKPNTSRWRSTNADGFILHFKRGQVLTNDYFAQSQGDDAMNVGAYAYGVSAVTDATHFALSQQIFDIVPIAGDLLQFVPPTGAIGGTATVDSVTGTNPISIITTGDTPLGFDATWRVYNLSSVPYQFTAQNGTLSYTRNRGILTQAQSTLIQGNTFAYNMGGAVTAYLYGTLTTGPQPNNVIIQGNLSHNNNIAKAQAAEFVVRATDTAGDEMPSGTIDRVTFKGNVCRNTNNGCFYAAGVSNIDIDANTFDTWGISPSGTFHGFGAYAIGLWNVDTVNYGINAFSSPSNNIATGGTSTGIAAPAIIASDLSTTGTTYLGGVSGSQAFRVPAGAAGIDYLDVVPTASPGNGTVLTTRSSTANSTLYIVSKGTGGVTLEANGQIAFGAFNTAVDSVNFVTAHGAIAGARPAVTGTGTDTDVDLQLGVKGAGFLYLNAPVKMPALVGAANCAGQPSKSIISTTGTGVLVQCP